MSARGQFSSKLGFIMAAAGAAVGLGNIWKFPYITGENGGGVFVLVYLLTVVFIGMSIFIAEVVVGSSTNKDSVSAIEMLSPEKKKPLEKRKKRKKKKRMITIQTESKTINSN